MKQDIIETSWSRYIDSSSWSIFLLNVFLLYVGYFAVDTDSTPKKLVFNRTVTLRDSYSKGGK